jgi:hypothetical protein
VPITNDTVFEGATGETFSVNLASPTNATIADPLGAGTITDNDSAPTITSVDDPLDGGINSVTVAEGTSAVFTVALSNASSTDTIYPLVLSAGSALLTSDYTNALTFSAGVSLSGGNVTVPAGVTSFTVTVPTVNDAINEPSPETFTLSVGSVTGTGYINDNDGAPTLSVNDVTVNESAGTASFTVTLSAVSAQTITVAYNTTDGTATAGADYTSATGTLTFAPGTTSQTISVPITNDTVFEGATGETFSVNLASPTNATIADPLGAGTITDNDSAPTITSVDDPLDGGINSVTVAEGTSAVFTVALSNASSTDTIYPLVLSAGSALLTSDYTNALTFSAGVSLSGGNVTVPAGVTSFTVTVPTVNDAINEPSPETFTLAVGGVTGTGYINDNDGAPTLSVNDVTVNESAGTASFTVTLSAVSAQTITVAYNTTDGTATAGADYTSATGTLTFAPGTTAQTISVPITNDTVFEGATGETFSVNLLTPTNATIADPLGAGTITDNDTAPTITSVDDPLDGGINSVTVAEGTSAVFTVALSNASSTDTIYPLVLSAGSALLTSDYTNALTFSAGVSLSGGNVTVPAGVTSFTVTVPTVNDAINEPSPETFTLSVGSVTGTGYINDNDGAPSLSVNDVTVSESDGTASFTVTLSAVSAQTITVAYNTSNGTATAGADYTGATGTLTFAPGTTAQTISVPITNDTTAELSETFNVNLLTPTNATIADNQGVGTITDNDTPSISGARTSSVSEEGLTNGIVDTIGTTDTTNSVTNTGQFTVSNATGVTMAVPSGIYTAGGTTITWALTNGNQTLTGSAGAQTVMTVTIDNAGNYTTTLLAPIDHANNAAEDVRTIDIPITATNGVATAPTTLTVSVEDDAPSATNTASSVTLPNVNTNIQLILDVSGSMSTTDAGGGKTRLQLMKESVTQLLDSYDNLGEIRVNLVTFSTSAAQLGSIWVDIVTAKAIINGGTVNGTTYTGLVANGWTNYDAALTTAQTAFATSGKISGGQNITYFLSDGEPTRPTGSEGISPAEETVWTNFLDANDIKSFAFGMGTGASQANIDPIAYNGVTPVNIPGVVVSDITQLPPILRDSVVAATPGNVITSGGTSVGFGGDGSGNIETLTIDGSIYTFNPTDTPTVGGSVTVSGTNRGVFNTVTNTLTVTTLINGSFVVDLDTGDYTYTAAPTITSVQQENIAYTVRDRDGDPAAASLTITVNPPPVGPAVPINVLTVSSPAAVAEGANLVYTVNLGLMTSNTATTFALALGGGTASNSDYNAIPTAFSNGVTYNSGTGLITVPASVVSFTVTVATLNDNVIDGATAETLPLIVGGVTGTGRITDTDTPTLAGATNGNNTLTGDNNVNIIDGLGGNDTIDARGGNDLIRGGAGNDTMTGGSGTDTFVFQLADKGTAGTPAADVVTDIRAQAGDRLDLSDLLQGENHTTGIGNLLNYMSFEQVGGNVLVHVSSAGSLDAGRTNVTAVEDQTIQLNTTTLLQLGGTDDTSIITALLANGKLIVD